MRHGVGSRVQYLAGREQNAQRDREIEPPGVFGQVGRRQIYGNSPRGKVVAAGMQRRAYPLARFSDPSVGQTYDDERWQARAHVNFNADGLSLETVERSAGEYGQ